MRIGLSKFDFFSFCPRTDFATSELPPPILTREFLYLILKALVPIEEKLSFKLWFMASIAVIIPMSAMIPNAIMATVILVRNLLARTVRQASVKESKEVIPAIIVAL